MAGSVKPGEYETITGGLSSLVHWLQEASNPSRRADMLRTLTVCLYNTIAKLEKMIILSLQRLLSFKLLESFLYHIEPVVR